MKKTKKSVACGFDFASNRKSLPTVALKTQESYYAGDNISVVKCSTFLGNILKFRPFLTLPPRLNDKNQSRWRIRCLPLASFQAHRRGKAKEIQHRPLPNSHLVCSPYDVEPVQLAIRITRPIVVSLILLCTLLGPVRGRVRFKLDQLEDFVDV